MLQQVLVEARDSLFILAFSGEESRVKSLFGLAQVHVDCEHTAIRALRPGLPGMKIGLVLEEV